MKLLTQIKAAYYHNKAVRLRIRSAKLHAEMFRIMTPYVQEIERLDKEAYKAHKMAAVTSIEALRDKIAEGESETFGATVV